MIMTALERTLKARLESESSVAFVFRKSNGELRLAHGTRNLDFVPLHQRPRHAEAESSTAMTYYDHDKRDWRSFKFGTLLRIEA